MGHQRARLWDLGGLVVALWPGECGKVNREVFKGGGGVIGEALEIAERLVRAYFFNGFTLTCNVN